MHFCLLQGAKGKAKQFLRRHSFVHLLLKYPLQEGKGPFCEFVRKKLLWFERLKLNQKIFLCLRFPRIFADEHFEESHPNGPNITFEAILVLIECLRRHINGRAYVI